MGVPVFCVKHQKIHECDYNQNKQISQRNEKSIKDRMQRILNPAATITPEEQSTGGVNGLINNARTRNRKIKDKLSDLDDKINEDFGKEASTESIQSKMDLIRARVMGDGDEKVKKTKQKQDGELTGLAKKAAEAYKKNHKELLDKLNKNEEIKSELVDKKKTTTKQKTANFNKKNTVKRSITEATKTDINEITFDFDQELTGKYITVEEAKSMIKTALSKVISKEINDSKKESKQK